ncbi:MAG: hypothetical protein M3R24_35625 [Chloroflexota bacterium]|nr:hypothetical protein [Chloroflexota bacterium]
MRLSASLRYGLWLAVAGTAYRNRKEYGVPTAWLTHLVGNTITLLLPEWLRLLQHLTAVTSMPGVEPVVRTLDQRVRHDPRYAGYVAPLALGFVASHPSYSIYHGRWAERTILGFGIDSLPHASAAYALARLLSQTLLTLDAELPPHHPLAPLTRRAVPQVDLLAAAAVALVTLVWEVSEYQAHQAELNATGRDAAEINMQWSWPDAITDSISNLAGLLAAIMVRRRHQISAQHSTPLSSDPISI